MTLPIASAVRFVSPRHSNVRHVSRFNPTHVHFFCAIQAVWQKDGMIRPLPVHLHAAALSFGGYRLRIVHIVNEREPPLRFVYSST